MAWVWPSSAPSRPRRSALASWVTSSAPEHEESPHPMGIASRYSLRDWLRAPGSLSQRLARLGQRYEVELLSQRIAPLRAQERAALGLPRRGCTVVREVILRVDPCTLR
eukprot:Opistho-2@58210